MNTMTKDPYDFWRRALAGAKIGTEIFIHEDQPECGFYRKRTGKAAGYDPVAIWRKEDGTLTALLNGREVDPSDIWTYCADKPVSEAHYRERMDTGRWWDEDESVTTSLPATAGRGHNQPPEVDSIKDQIEAALKGVDGYTEVNDDATAAKAQGLRSRLLELSRDADKRREAEKKPHLEASRAVDETWQPLVKSAKAGADTIQKALSAHATRVQRAAEDAARKEAEKAAQEAAKHAPIGAEPEPVAPAPVAAPAPIRGAYGRAASQKKVKVAKVVDQDAAYAHFKAQTEVVELIAKLAQKSVTAGFTVPGVEVTEEIKVV